MKMTPFHSKFLMKKMKMKVFCCSSNVALATFSQRLLAEKPQMVDLDKRDRHSIYIRTVSSQLLLCSGTFVSMMAGLGQKSSVLCMLLCPKGP